MADKIIWWLGIVVEFMILWRALGNRSLLKYPFFYLYVASAGFCDVWLYVLSTGSELTYRIWSERAEILNLVLGYGIVLEIFRHVLSRYPGAERFARIVGIIVFVLIFCFAVIYPLASTASGTTGPALRKITIERDFLTVQAIFFLGILSIISYYGLEAGRNIRGMMLGYGVWLGTSLITLSLRFYIGSSFNAVWMFVQPFSYLLSLVVWLNALWDYSPVPVSQRGIRLDADYESFVAVTRGLMGQMRSHLGRAARP